LAGNLLGIVCPIRVQGLGFWKSMDFGLRNGQGSINVLRPRNGQGMGIFRTQEIVEGDRDEAGPANVSEFRP
jgi:hypothetical protein